MTAAVPFDHSSEDVVVPEQLAIQVFVNGAGNVAIAQDSGQPFEDSAVVVILPMHAETVADAIVRAAKEARRNAGVTRDGEA